MKRKIFCLVLCGCLSANLLLNHVTIFAENGVEVTNSLEDFTVSQEFDVKNSNDTTISVSVEPSVVDKVSEDMVCELLEDKKENDDIQIISTETLAKEEIVDDIYVLDDDSIVEVNVNEECKEDISSEEIADVIEENEFNTGDVLNIDDLEEVENSQNDNCSVEKIEINENEYAIEPQWKWYDLWLYITTSWYYGGEYQAKDVFIASVARGETYTLTKKFSSSLALSLEAGGTYMNVTGSITASQKITYSVEKKHKFTGPNKKSKNNTREYRVRFYAKECYVTQKVKGNISKHTSTYKATYKVPTKYLSYSIDRKV